VREDAIADQPYKAAEQDTGRNRSWMSFGWSLARWLVQTWTLYGGYLLAAGIRACTAIWTRSLCRSVS